MKHRVQLINPTIMPVGVEILEEKCDVFLAPDGSEETLIRCINESKAEGLIARVEPITRKVIESCPSLKAISAHGVGFDHIDVEAATERGIRVLNVPDANYTSVAEHAIMFILAMARNVLVTDGQVRKGNWQFRNTNLPHDIAGKTLLIVALGRIGRDVAKKAKALDMNVIAFDGYVSREAMEELGVKKVDTLEEGLKEADYVTIHAPLTPETKGMFSDAQFEVMKPSTYLINCGRGPVVDQAALYRALKENKIAGAGLDVFEQEPPEDGNPLFELENITVTAHNAGDTYESRLRCSSKAATNLIKALDGEETYNWINKRAMEAR